MGMPISQNGEQISIMAPDGDLIEFVLDSSLKSYNNLGTAGFNFITSKAFRQDGSSLIDQFAEERVIVLEYQEICTDRQDWWDRRRELQAFFRPNRGGVFRLIIQQPERTFSIGVMPDPGLEFADSDISSLTIQETIRLRAFDPFWVEGDVDPAVFSEITGTDLVFPITFPIVFGVSGRRFTTGILNYTGSAKSYPIITITGPYSTATLIIWPQNKRIRLSVEVDSSATRIIDPNPSNPQIVDLDGVSHFNELDLISNPLQDFAVLPEPPGENQYIEVVFTGSTANETTATIQLETRYIGI